MVRAGGRLKEELQQGSCNRGSIWRMLRGCGCGWCGQRVTARQLSCWKP